MTPHDQTELARALFEEIGDALFLLDPESDQLLDVNPFALRLTGFTRAELLQFPATYLFRVDATGSLQRLRGAFNKTVVFHGQDGFLLRTKEESGWVPVSLTVSRLHVEPKPLGLIIARDDRERRAALAQARRVEAELRTVLTNSPAALWSAERGTGPDVLTGWHFRYVSGLLARIAGRPAEFLDHPMKWAEVVHPADREPYRASVRGLLSGTASDLEQVYRVQTPDGTVRWVRDRLQVVRDSSTRPTRMDGCVADVTAQREAEEALRQSERRFRALVEKSRDGILLLDEKGVVRYASPAVKATLGYDPAELTGKSAFSFVHPDDVPAMRERLATVLARPGEDVPGRFRAFALDGSVRHLESNGCNRLKDPSVRAIVVNYRDVTERDRAARDLEQQHALLEALFASVPDIICYKDKDLRFLGGNPAFEELAGRPMAQVVGKTCREVFHDEWAAAVRAVEPKVLQTTQAVRARHWVTYPDRRRVLLDIVISPLRGDGGEVTGLIIVARDVTDRDRLEEALRESQKMEAVGRLAGGIAHDFNNLLTVILGNLELVGAGADPADVKELLESSGRAAKQAADLTRQMLGFARRQPLQRSVVDLNALARESLALLRRTIDPRIAVAFEPSPDLRAVTADPVQVQQVLMNLCLNARDSMPDGGRLRVETANADALPGVADGGPALPPSDPRRPEFQGGEPATRYVRLSVADTGVGMTEEVRAKIFEPFFTTKEIGKGTGLGLATVYGIAHAHGGAVVCRSEPGRGSRFDVYLPAAAAAEEAEKAAAARTADRGHGETVLVADDERGVRDLARAGLELHGYKVLLAAEGAEAVEVFRREGGRVGLVVLDATMPHMTGRQAFEAIRAIDPRVPVLFASGHPEARPDPDSPPERTAFLHKPYTPMQLAAEVRRMLDAIAGPPADADARTP